MRRACVGVRVYSKKNAAIKNVFKRDFQKKIFKNINFPKNVRKNWTNRTRIRVQEEIIIIGVLLETLFHWRPTSTSHWRPPELHCRPTDFHWRPPDFRRRPQYFYLRPQTFCLKFPILFKNPRIFNGNLTISGVSDEKLGFSNESLVVWLDCKDKYGWKVNVSMAWRGGLVCL